MAPIVAQGRPLIDSSRLETSPRSTSAFYQVLASANHQRLDRTDAQHYVSTTMLEDFDLHDFWKNCDYADDYLDEPPSDEIIAEVEADLGYRLPASYVALARHQNGGIPNNVCHRAAGSTSWAEDHVALSGIFSIGSSKLHSLCGESGSRFWIEEWGYPEIGIYFADCPSAGHDMLCLDYRECGPAGEPRVVHVDQDRDFKITFVAESFDVFLKGLEPYEAYETD